MKQYEELKNEITSLKIRLRRLEEFILAMPNGEDYIHENKTDALSDPAFEEAVEIIKGYDEASASLLQRRLQIGYARASRLLDTLEEKGYIEKAKGTKPRKVIKK